MTGRTAQVMGDTAFRTALGEHGTPLDAALATTLAWYRDAADLDRPAATRRS